MHPVAGTVMVAVLSGQQVHRSRAKWSDFSCRCQSYFAGKVSVQKVHWNIRADRDLACWAATRWVIGARRRRRLSEEPLDRFDRFDMEEPKVSSELEESRVSKLECDGARNIEKDESSEEFLREPGFEPGCDELEELRPGKGILVTARAIAVIEAGSFSGGEAFHLSMGLRFSHSSLALFGPGISIAPSIGEEASDIGRTFPLRLAFASQFEIWLRFSPVSCFSSSFSLSLGYG